MWWPTIAIVVMAFIGLSNQVIRYRQSSLSERAQIKWIIVGFCFANVGLLLLILQPFLFDALSIDSAGHRLFNFFTLLFGLMAVFIPISIAIALLRYDLWNVDFILNRTLVYGGVTAVILLIYAVTVGGLSLLWRSQNNLVVSLLATGFIAVLFQPIRERLQRGVNRLMFGERDDPYKVLSQLGWQLGETAVPHQTLPAITTTICQTLKLPYAAIELVANDQRQPAASSGELGTAVPQEWPLRYQGEIVGWLQAAPRSPGEPFTTKEQQLLGDIAAQSGAVAYSLRLTNVLQKSREKLVLAREEERRRIRRDLHDELGPTLASQTFVFDTILELLESNPTEAVRLLRGLKAQNQATVTEIRRLVYELRPPALDELGLVGALQAQAAHLNGPQTPQVQIAARPDPLPLLSAAVEVAAYRIALEAITNVVRHAQARQCDVCLRVMKNGRSQLQIEITDNGIGLPADLHLGVGLTSMRERAEELGGSLSVTKLAEGTQLMAQLPL